MHIASPFSPPLSAPVARIDLELDQLEEIAKQHRRLCYALGFDLIALFLPPLSLVSGAIRAWITAQLGGALKGEGLSLLHLFLAIFPLTSLPQLVILDRRTREAFRRHGVRVGSLSVTALNLAQAEARIRRRYSVPPPAPGPRMLVPREPARVAQEVPPDLAKTQVCWKMNG